MKEIYLESKKVMIIGFLLSIPITLFYVFEIENNWNNFYKLELELFKKQLIFESKILKSFIVFLAPMLIMFLGIIVHEIIHGIFMAIYSKNNFKSVKFGFDFKHYMPFANCLEPLLPNQMVIVSLAPFFFLGLLPTIYAVIYKDIFVLFFGFSMVLGAAGDFIYAYLIFTKIKDKNKKILDHKSKVGYIIID